MDNLFNSILVVDNMPDVLACTELFFQISGFEVHTAGRTKEAIELYRTLQKAHRTPQVVVADGALGLGDDGFTLLAKIKDLDRQKRTTTFIYTAHGIDRARLLAIGSGAESIIDKMKVGDALLGEINNGLRNKARRMVAGSARAAGQFGGSWFTNREMAIYALNFIFIIAVVWFVGRMDYQLSTLTSNERLTELKVADVREKLAAKGLLNNIKESEK